MQSQEKEVNVIQITDYRPYYRTAMGMLYLGEARAVMAGLENNSIDLAMADPPYNVGKDYGVYKDNLPEKEYVAFVRDVIAECQRICRRGVAFYVKSGLTKLYWDLLPEAKQIVVYKRAAGARSNGYFLQYFSLLVTAKPCQECKDLWDDIRLPGEGYYFREKRYDSPGLTSLILMKRIVHYFTEEGDIVLDPFLGTGTGAVACEQLGRRWIGIEIDPGNCEGASRRIDTTTPQLGMFPKKRRPM